MILHLDHRCALTTLEAKCLAARQEMLNYEVDSRIKHFWQVKWFTYVYSN